jgi:hypothetical protein
MDFLVKIFLLTWVILLFMYAKYNNNLRSLLIIIAIPKAIDLFLLTHLLEPLKQADNEYRYYFYLVHATNDLLMLLLIRFRFFVVLLISNNSLYREMKVEKFIAFLFFASICMNILTYGDFFKFWEYTFGTPKAYFYYLHVNVQHVLITAEIITLGYLTAKTITVARQLKKAGLIS